MDSNDTKTKIRQDLIQSLELSSIMDLRGELKCREGLLIDFDYGASLLDDMEIGVGKTTQVEQGLDKEDKEGETVPEVVDRELQSNEVGSESRYPFCTFPQEPSGSRTVCFS